MTKKLKIAFRVLNNSAPQDSDSEFENCLKQGTKRAKAFDHSTEKIGPVAIDKRQHCNCRHFVLSRTIHEKEWMSSLQWTT